MSTAVGLFWGKQECKKNCHVVSLSFRRKGEYGLHAITGKKKEEEHDVIFLHTFTFKKNMTLSTTYGT